MNPKTLLLLQQVFGRFLIHLALYPVILIVALSILLGHIWPAGIHGSLHPFQNAAGQHDQEFAPQYVSDQFAYYALVPSWLVLGVLTSVLFGAKRSSQLVRRCCLTLFSF